MVQISIRKKLRFSDPSLPGLPASTDDDISFYQARLYEHPHVVQPLTGEEGHTAGKESGQGYAPDSYSKPLLGTASLNVSRQPQIKR